MELDDFDVRHLEIRDTTDGSRRKVIHIIYTNWPEQGMPESAVPILQVDFIRTLPSLVAPALWMECTNGLPPIPPLLSSSFLLLPPPSRPLSFSSLLPSLLPLSLLPFPSTLCLPSLLSSPFQLHIHLINFPL